MLVNAFLTFFCFLGFWGRQVFSFCYHISKPVFYRSVILITYLAYPFIMFCLPAVFLQRCQAFIKIIQLVFCFPLVQRLPVRSIQL